MTHDHDPDHDPTPVRSLAILLRRCLNSDEAAPAVIVFTALGIADDLIDAINEAEREGDDDEPCDESHEADPDGDARRALDGIYGPAKATALIETARAMRSGPMKAPDPAPAVPTVPARFADRLAFDPAVSATSPCVRGTRVTVEHVINRLSEACTWSDILNTYPELRTDDIRACWAYDITKEARRR